MTHDDAVEIIKLLKGIDYDLLVITVLFIVTFAINLLFK